MGLAIPLVGIGLSLAGTAAGVYGQSKAASSARRQDLQAQLTAREMAADSISRGGNLAAQALVNGGRIAASQRTQVAARGFEQGIGTAQDINDATDLVSSIDARTIRVNAAREGGGYLTQARNAGVAAKATSAKAGVFGTLLGGAASVSQQWAQYSLRKH